MSKNREVSWKRGYLLGRDDATSYEREVSLFGIVV